MQQTDQKTEPAYEQRSAPAIRRARRFPGLLSLALAILLLMMAFLPPLINVNRFQHRIATSIGQSLGRPVHLDNVSLTLLPWPGFTFTNFVVDEDPAFGSEPIIRAMSVRATLRISSLWRRRVEFSSISFTEPSVNLVHLSSGQWNLDSILLHAAHIEAAPTAQKKAGPTPRFPYIEATGARLNLKLNQEKTPISLTDADFALWLPEPQQWHLRLEGQPARTDTSVSGAGTIRVEGTLGRAPSLGQVALSLDGEWSGAPLGEATQLLFGHDAGIRGNILLNTTIQGIVSNAAVRTRLRLIDARRADFVPDDPLNVDLECLATAASDFHAFQNIRCSWPPIGSSAPLIDIAGDIPDIRDLRASTLQIGTPGIFAPTLLSWLRIVTPRVSPGVAATGTLTGSLVWNRASATPQIQPLSLQSAIGLAPVYSATPPASKKPIGLHQWTGELLLANATLTTPKTGRTSLIIGDISLRPSSAATEPGKPAPPPPGKAAVHPPHAPPPVSGFDLTPTALALGGKEPAMLEGHFDRTGYTLHLTGMASTSRLLALGSAIPQFGDGLADVLPTNRATGPYRVDLTAIRHWHAPQVWTDSAPLPVPPHPQHRPRH